MNWIEAEGPSADIVLSTRIRLARNLENYPFPSRHIARSLSDVVSLVASRVEVATDLVCHDVHRFHPLELHLLVERHLVSPAFVNSPLPRAVAINQAGTQSLMVNEEDHLRIQSLLSGMQFGAGWEMTRSLTGRLAEGLEFARDPQFGFLTACPSNLGTGMRASAMLHLPGLVHLRALESLMGQMASVGLTIRGLYGEGSACNGHLVQLSNQVTLGLDEAAILAKVESVCQQLLQYEQSARSQLMENQKVVLEDRSWRSFGLLCHARQLSGQEAIEHFSNLRLGVSLGILPRLSIPTLNRLLVQTRAANLQVEAGREIHPSERDVLRAGVVRQILRVELERLDGSGPR